MFTSTDVTKICRKLSSEQAGEIKATLAKFNRISVELARLLIRAGVPQKAITFGDGSPGEEPNFHQLKLISTALIERHRSFGNVEPLFTRIERPAIVRPRKEAWCDWDSVRVVLARVGTKELWWHKAGNAWQNQMDGYQPFAAKLRLADIGDGDYPYEKDIILHEGGRLSRELIAKFTKEIDSFFDGKNIALLVRPGQTVIWDSGT